MYEIRTAFISDVHLGSPACKAEKLLEFLATYKAETIYLVGDIIDGWYLIEPWPETHNKVVRTILGLTSNLIYIPGNHDFFFRSYINRHILHVAILESAIHLAADGKQYFVIHGDQFDGLLWIAAKGRLKWFLKFSILIRIVNRILDCLVRIESKLIDEAYRRGADGVICGHTHNPMITEEFGLLYMNCGDWVESLSAIIEHKDGRMELIRL